MHFFASNFKVFKVGHNSSSKKKLYFKRRKGKGIEDIEVTNDKISKIETNESYIKELK